MKIGENNDSVLAFDIGGTRIKAGVVRGCETLSFHSEPLNRQESAADFVETLTRIGRDLCEQQSVTAVGISIKGIVDTRQGTILEVKEALAELVGQPLTTQLSDAFNLPVEMENDARMHTLGELLYGAGRSVNNMVCLTLGTGVGCGVAINRQILRGPRGLSGILGGHISVQAGGRRCNCGNIGCLEAYIGTTAFIETAQQQIERYPTSYLASLSRVSSLTPLVIFSAATEGDEVAQKLVEDFTRYLSVGVVSLFHGYGPELVVLGGGIMGAASQILPSVQQYVAEHSWKLIGQQARVSAAELGDTAALVGAAALALHGGMLFI